MGASNNFGLDIPERLGLSISRFTAMKAAIMQSIRVSVPAIVQSFDPGPPATVVLQIALQEYVQQSDPAGPLNPVTAVVDLPLLYDVPISIPTAGGMSLTLPIKPGDECMVVFSDTALDSWLHSGGTKNAPISQRRHSLSDAIAVFGLRSTPRGLANYSMNSAQLRNDDGTVVFDLADDQITVTAPNVVVNAENATVNASTEAKVAAPTVEVSASVSASVKAPTVVLGTTAKSRDFLYHTHTSASSGFPTGPVL